MVDYNYLYKGCSICKWYLFDYQKPLLNMCYSHVDVVTKCHRRFGKDSVILAYASERATNRKNFLVRYGAPTLKQAYEISDFLLTKIYSHDVSCKPIFVTKGGYWDYGNGSKMTLFGGADKEEVEKGRGVEADLIILSEFAFFKYRPTYLLKEVLSPQLLTTRGQKIIVSTVPEDLTHPYVEELSKAEADGRAFVWTIDDSLRVCAIDDEQNQKIIKDCGGVDSDAYKREYKCLLIPSSKRLIVPEAQNNMGLWIQDVQRPKYYTPYVCIDLGLHDFSVALFGYHDFDNNRLVIEAEHRANYTTTKVKSEAWKETEKILDWKDNQGKQLKPKRFSDNDAQQIFDLCNDHQYNVNPISKRVTGDNSQNRLSFAESVINKMRIGLGQNKIVINPKCKFLISTLKYGIWNDRRTDFERSDELGHFDAGIDLAYLYDNVAWQSNPYPAIPDGAKESTHYINHDLIKKKQDSLRLLMGKSYKGVIKA